MSQLADIARWMFWGPLRASVSPSLPILLRGYREGWTVWWRSAVKNRSLMADEYRRCFGECLNDNGYERLVQDAYKAAWRTHLEELLISKLDAENIDAWVTLNGVENLKTALDRGQGVVWVYPHAGPVMLMIAGLAHRGFPYVQYAARGLAPADMAQAHPELLAPNRWRVATRQARETHENALPVEFLTLDEPVRTLHRRLEQNHIIGIAFDGRLGTGWEPMSFLHRTALLSPGPWKLACSTNATILPVFCHTPADGPAVVEIGQPVLPESDWRSIAKVALNQQTQWLRQHPEEYGLWLLHTRQRCGIDDHPLFIDTAPDDRYRRWMKDD